MNNRHLKNKKTALLLLLSSFAFATLLCACDNSAGVNAEKNGMPPKKAASKTTAPKKMATKKMPSTNAASSSPKQKANNVFATGTISLAEGQKPAGSTLFISIRAPSGGPPIAAQRMSVTKFPITFEMNDTHKIAMGGTARAVPESFNLKVAIDADGDPMTKSKDDLRMQQTVKRGSTGLNFVLKSQ